MAAALLAGLVVVLLLTVYSNIGVSEPQISPVGDSIVEEIGEPSSMTTSDDGGKRTGSLAPPCSRQSGTIDLCERRSTSSFNLFSLESVGAAYTPDSESTIEDLLENGLRLAGVSPVHLAFRGTAIEGSVRCDWRGVARAMDQREKTIRYWLQIDEAVALPSASVIESLFAAILNSRALELPESTKASFRALAQGGLTTEFTFLTCYADYEVSEYLLGSGPSELTIAYDRLAEAKSFDLYTRAYEVGEFGNDVLGTEEEYAAAISLSVLGTETALAQVIEDRESVVMLAPMGAHNAIAFEAWQAIEQWDLQEDDDDVVQAVRYGVPEGDPEHTQTLANLRTRVTTAAGSDAFATSRIGNVSGLQQYYRDIGAYGDITPEDGSTATFTPAQPPAAYSCASGTAVTTPGENLGLVHDCENLFDGKDALRGTGSLNWSTSTAIGSWDGVTTAGTPTRVTKVELDDEDLTGTIPAGLGSLFALTRLDLSDNALTGDIPGELGWLHNLEEVRLSGNSLSGCIPLALRDVATNDFSSLNLPYCRPPAPGAPTAGTVGETSVPLSWTAVANVSKYRVEYRESGPGYWEVDGATITGTSHTVDGLLCEEEYEFRLSAFGDGTTYGAAWSDPGAAAAATTAACVPPVFSQESYRFSVMVDAAVDAEVGTVSATDDGTVTYAITSGNEDERFAIDEGTGAITVAASLSGEAGTTVTLTVAATDDAGGTSMVTVTVAVTQTCDSGTAAPNPAANPGLVADCQTLLALQGDLAGAATLNWSADRAISGWDGITLGGTPQRVTRVSLERRGLTGVIPPSVGDLTGLEYLRLGYNQLTGAIPVTVGSLTALDYLQLNDNRLSGPVPKELGALTNLVFLYLQNNDLTEGIPAALGNLTAVRDVWLQQNDLTGPIPPELGNLTGVRRLWLAGNDLSKTIPAELTNLTDLTLLLLAGNALEGCVPPSLRDIGLNDLGSLGLVDCQAGPGLPGNVGASLTDKTFALTWGAVSGSAKYEPQVTTDAADAATVTWTALPAVETTSTTYTGVCETAYRFRVRAYGDGYTYATHWGPESAATAAETTPVCNPPPVFDEDPYTFTVDENALVDAPVGTVSAMDPDPGDAVTYHITDDDGGPFAIDHRSGNITVQVALNHEESKEYTLTVEARDGRGGAGTATVNVTVADVNEAPAFDQDAYAFTVDEDAAAGAAVGDVSATDPDDGDTVTYQIKGSVFAIDGRSGAITVNAALDYETNPSYPLTVEVRDGEGLRDTATVTVTVADVNEAPVFDEPAYEFTLDEDAGENAAVGMVSATDPDDGDTLTYTITDDDGGPFAINSGSGAITVAGALDHEDTEAYTLAVEARDGGGLSDTVTVTVTVSDVAEDAPTKPTGIRATLAGDTFTLAWDAVTGAAKYEPQVSTDGGTTWTALPETPVAGATYGAACGAEYRFRVRAYGDGEVFASVWGPESTATAARSSRACNRPPAFDPPTYEFDVAENAAAGALVGTVTATDPDLEDTQTYSITDDDDGPFAINSGSSGAITVAGALDYEDTGTYTLTVEVRDGGGLRATATVTVTVTDVNEAPEFDETAYAFSVAENAAEDFAVGTVSATDPDDGDTVTYSITAGNPGSAFAIGGGSGAITVTRALDHETAPRYTLTVTAQDDGGLNDTVVVTVTVTDVNEAPAFDAAPYAFSVAENAAAGGLVGTVSATDPDMDTLTYTITNDGPFAIGGSSGAITVAGALDHETGPTYTLTVTADDKKGGTDTATVVITVMDVAEDPPPAPATLAATLVAGTFSLSWDAVKGAEKYEAEVTTDAADAATVTWTALAETTATTQTYRPTDGPTCSTAYRFRVRAYGDGDTYAEVWGPESGADSVTTASCNQPPSFGASTYDFFIRDTAAAGSAVGQVAATDADTGDALTYAITAGNDAGKFAIDSGTGRLTVAGTTAFNLASIPYYALTVETSDGNGGTATARLRVSLTIAACHNGTVVPRPDEYTRLVRDCSVLLTAKDTLRGTANLDWSADTPIRQWQGIYTGWLNPRVHLDVATIHVKDVIVSRIGLNGSVPSVLAGLVDLHRLDLDDNALTGEIPAALGQLEYLELLHLLGNRLTGSIPTELGNLSNLRILSLYANDLTGAIPAELGKLTSLEQLLLDDNDFTGELPSELANIAGLKRLYVRESRLTGAIPAWLADMDALEHLFLEGNDFTGCIPEGLRDVDTHDLDRLELTDCTTREEDSS